MLKVRFWHPLRMVLNTGFFDGEAVTPGGAIFPVHSISVWDMERNELTFRKGVTAKMTGGCLIGECSIGESFGFSVAAHKLFEVTIDGKVIYSRKGETKPPR